MCAWVPDAEETEQQSRSTDAEIPLVQPVSVAEQNDNCMAKVEVEPLK